MRLKTLRKERPSFEIEGALINGSRMDISSSDLKAIRHRSNTLVALPASLNPEPSILNVSPLGYADEMHNYSSEHALVPALSQTSNPAPYQTIEAAYLEHGIRIRLSPTRITTTTGQPSERKTTHNFQRRTAFTSRNPYRSSSVLQYATSKQGQYSDTRSFSALQQMSTNDFEQTNDHIKSYAQSSQITEEINDDYCSSVIKVNESSNSMGSPEIFSTIDGITSSTTLYNSDPDLVYMSSLLQKPSGESMRETIRRRAGLRGTFAVHRNPLITNSNQQPLPPPPQQQQQQHNFREKSPTLNRNSLIHNTIIEVMPPASPDRIDHDILKHVSRIRKRTVSRDVLNRSPRANTASIISSSSRMNTSSVTSSSPLRINSMSITSSTPPRLSAISNVSSIYRANTISVAGSPLRMSSNNNYSYKQNSSKKPLKAMSLEPLELLLASASHSTSIGKYDLPTIKTSSASRNVIIPIKRTKSAITPIVKTSNTTTLPLKEHSILSSGFRDESLSSIKTSTIDAVRQSNSFDSGYFDRSSSGGDLQSLTSSSLIQIQNSFPSGRLNSSIARRSNTNKKVSFSEEPTAVILTTATYV
ncbi:unnamed protein product [Rotaria magnacalcarata]|uniref:Uncharacterized protein n=1 Tax=Rotaria magnacalcarata TaxID=392030 RepID=A0A820FS37_9BILA|nr:unnamed protein product [Rotaria magnacalcarata]CAF4264649.1 unnamed protein product [Rotaria magnacalcarata]